MNTLKYKDFTGSVAFSEADGVFFGKTEGIDGLVNFEGMRHFRLRQYCTLRICAVSCIMCNFAAKLEF